MWNHEVPNVGPISRERILKAIEEAEESFWTVIAKAFPEVTSGDVSPEWVVTRERDNNRSVVNFLDGNLPYEEEDDEDDDDVPMRESYEGPWQVVEGFIYSAADAVQEVLAGQAGGCITFRVALADGRYLAVGDLRDPFTPNWSDGGRIEPGGWSASLYPNLHAYENASTDNVVRDTEDASPLGLQKLLRALISDDHGCDDCGHGDPDHDGTGPCPLDDCQSFTVKIPADWPVVPLRTVYEREQAESHGGLTQCGTCDRYWDDSISTSLTPTPSGRCPFEYFH